MSNKLNYLKQPLTDEEIKVIADEDNYIEGIVAISETEMFYNDYENFLDLISEKLCNSPCLMNIQYEMIGCIPEESLIIYSISGDASCIIED